MTPPPDKPPKRGRVLSILAGFLSALLGPILLVAWGFGLLYGWNCDSLLMFHLIYAASILVPAIGIIVFAFLGREPWIFAGALCFIGITFLCLYATAVFYKLSPDTVDRLFLWYSELE